MNRLAMVFCLACLACSGDSGPGERGGESPPGPSAEIRPLRTYSDINDELARLLFEKPEPGDSEFDLLALLAAPGDPQAVSGLAGLRSILGGYILNELGLFDLVAVSASPVSLFLWRLAFDELAVRLAAVCQDPNPDRGFAVLRADVYQDLRAMCTWPSTSADAAMRNFWSTSLEHRAPADEVELWIAFFRSESAGYRMQRAPVLVQDALFAMWNSPYHLLGDF